MVHCILKGMCIYLYIHWNPHTHETRRGEATKALAEQQQIWSIIWKGYESILSFRLLSHFALLLFTSLDSFVCMSGMTHEFSMNVSINQSLSAHIRCCYCVQRIFFSTSLHPLHCVAAAIFYHPLCVFSLLKSNGNIICTVRFYCLPAFTYFSQLLAVSRCLRLKIDNIDFVIAFFSWSDIGK